MSDLATSPGADAGQAAPAAPDRSATGQAQGTPQAPEGQASAPSDTGHDFFDPANLPDDPEIQKAYKQMQGAFTKKMQEASSKLSNAEKYEQALQFLQTNPEQFISELASQHGFKLTKAEKEAMADGEWTPGTWEDVLARAEKQVFEKLKPVLEEVHKSKAQSFERALDDVDPMWRQHEKAFRDTLAAHPTLANDPKALFKQAMPDDYVMSKATSAALAKLKGQTDAAKMGGKSTARSEPAPTKVNSFDEAVQQAKAMIAAGKGFA